MLTGDVLAIESGVNNIKKMFNVTITKNVEEYLGCRIHTCRKGKIMVQQPHIYKHLEDKFQDVLDEKWKEKKKMSTPSTPSFKLLKSKRRRRSVVTRRTDPIQMQGWHPFIPGETHKA